MYKGGCDTYACWSIHFEVCKRKEELAWATDKWFWVISNVYVTFSAKTVPFGTFGILRNTTLKH